MDTCSASQEDWLSTSSNASFIKPNTKRKWRVNGAEKHNEILMTPYKTYEEAWEAYDRYTIYNCVEFIHRNSTILKTPEEGVQKKFERNACIFFDEYQLPKILPVMKFVTDNPIPFVPIGLLTLQCRHGPRDYGDPIKPPKKFIDRPYNCHAMVKILQIAFFPEYEILVDTDEYRKTAADQIRSAVHSGNAQYEAKYYLGISENHNHPVGEENAKYLRADPRVRDAGEKLVAEGVVYTRELSHFLKYFVEGMITAKVIPRPHPTNSRFYLQRNIINGLCRKVLQKMQEEGKEVPTPPWRDKQSGYLEEKRQRVFATATNPVQSALPPEQNVVSKNPKGVSPKVATNDEPSTSSIDVKPRPQTNLSKITPQEIENNRKMAKAIGCISLADELQNMSVPLKYRTIVQMYLNRISKLSTKLHHSDDLLAIGNSLKSLHDAVKHVVKSREKRRSPAEKPFLTAKSSQRQFHFTPIKKDSSQDKQQQLCMKTSRNDTRQRQSAIRARQQKMSNRTRQSIRMVGRNVKRRAAVQRTFNNCVPIHKNQKTVGAERNSPVPSAERSIETSEDKKMDCSNGDSEDGR